MSKLLKRQGIKIACLEEIALDSGWITKATVSENLKENNHQSSYSIYLRAVVKIEKTAIDGPAIITPSKV